MRIIFESELIRASTPGRGRMRMAKAAKKAPAKKVAKKAPAKKVASKKK